MKRFTASIYLTIEAQGTFANVEDITKFLRDMMVEYNGTEYVARAKEVHVKEENWHNDVTNV